MRKAVGLADRKSWLELRTSALGSRQDKLDEGKRCSEGYMLTVKTTGKCTVGMWSPKKLIHKLVH